MTTEVVQKHVFISGRVQGVGFRYFIQQNAADLNLKGWAKNLADGRVEVVISGNSDRIEQMINKLKEGPSFARVHDLEVNSESTDDFSGFSIRY